MDNSQLKHVFISYKHEEHSRAFVSQLIDKLREQGFISWIDEHISGGKEWRKEIDKAVEAAIAVIVVLTPESAVSPYVTYEWAYAMGIGKPIIPVLLDGFPSDLHPKLEPLQYRDFRNRKDPWDQLISDLKVAAMAVKIGSGKDNTKNNPLPPLKEREIKLVQEFFDTIPRHFLKSLRDVHPMDFNESLDPKVSEIRKKVELLVDYQDRPHLEAMADKALVGLIVDTCRKLLQFGPTPSIPGYSRPKMPNLLGGSTFTSFNQVKKSYDKLAKYVLENYPEISVPI